jgi:hypothetical protein
MRSALALVAVLAIVSAPAGRPARAAAPKAAIPPSDAVEAAKAHFAAGSAYYEQGNWADAAKEFKEAYRLSKQVDLLYNISLCEERLGNLDGAIAALRAYLAALPPDRTMIEARIAVLEKKRREAPPPPAASRPAPAAAPEPVPAPVAAAPSVAAPAPATAPAAVAATSERPARWWAPGAAVGAIGAAVLVAAIGTGVSALRTADELEHVCVDKMCPADQRARVSRGEALALSTDVLIGVGTAAVITSAILLGVQSRRRPSPLSASAAGLTIQF